MLKNNRPLLLTLVCVALGALVIYDNWQDGDGDVVGPRARMEAPAPSPAADEVALGDTDAAAPRAAQLELHNPLAAFDKGALNDWVERPLSAPSRQRPPAVAAAERPLARQIANKLPPPSYDLLGIVRDGDRAIALLRKKGEGTSFRVEVGDMIGGWRVARMETASVVLERADGTSQTVPLSRE